MPNPVAEPKVAHLFSPVKPQSINKLSTPPNSMIHHKDHSFTNTIIYKYKKKNTPTPYGVSSSYRVLSPQLLLKKHDCIRNCLDDILELTPSQREVIFRLLRFWAYYGYVYPKEAQVTSEPGCSKATFWRTIRYLKQMGMITVINRYVLRPHAQISNLYRLDRLIVLLARYLAEHGAHFYEKWLEPYLSMPGRLFWGEIYRTSEARAGP